MGEKYDEWINFAHFIPSRRAANLFMLLEKYLNLAINQYDRIQKGKQNDNTKELYILFGDCHFYFITINKFSEILYKLYEVTGFEEIVDLRENNKEYFKSYNEIRNHYEHIEERTSSLKKEFANPKYYLSDFGNIANDKFTFGGVEYDISEESINTLISIYEEVVAVIKKINQK